MDQLAVVERVIQDFPCLTPLSNDLGTLVGYVKLSSRNYRLSLRTDCAVLRGDKSLHALLSDHASTVARRLSLAPNAHALLLELRALVERATAAASSPDKSGDGGIVQLPPRSFYERLLREVGSIGWNRVNLHETLRSLEVRCEDSAKRAHTLSISLPLDYPVSLPTIHALLPESFEPFASDESANVSLLDVVARFELRLKDFELLWNVLDDIDTNCQVVEPENPTKAETYRRIIIDGRSSLRIEFDARSPVVAFPTVRFLGSSAAVAPLRARLNEHVHLWDSSGATLPRENLCTVLDLDFPPPKAAAADTGEEGMEGECGICYAYRHEGRVPDVACDRLECAKAYHRTCLVDWLRALPDTRQSFDTLMGACVYCEHPISVNAMES